MSVLGQLHEEELDELQIHQICEGQTEWRCIILVSEYHFFTCPSRAGDHTNGYRP